MSSVFSGLVFGRTAPGFLDGTTVSAVTTGVQLSAAELLGGVQSVTVGGVGALTVTLPTAATLGAALYTSSEQIAVGSTFDFTINNTQAGAYTLTNSDFTVVGANIAAANAAGTSTTFRIRCTALPTNAAGAGAAFTIYRAA